jgi:mediator of RNA polymerase II transcription subunit 8, fungi type
MLKMSDLNADQIRNLEQLRQRLISLNASLGALRGDLATSLPSWTTLQSHSNLIASNLNQINNTLSDHADLLASTVVFPSMHFPGRNNQEIIDTLLRTKQEPDVEEWFEQGVAYGNTLNGGTGQILRESDRKEFWAWAPRKANETARRQKWGADYTAEEIDKGVENVVTGLKRELVVPVDQDDEDEDEEEEYEDDDDDEAGGGDKMDTDDGPDGVEGEQKVIASQQMPLQSVQRFMVSGKVG